MLQMNFLTSTTDILISFYTLAHSQVVKESASILSLINGVCQHQIISDRWNGWSERSTSFLFSFFCFWFSSLYGGARDVHECVFYMHWFFQRLRQHAATPCQCCIYFIIFPYISSSLFPPMFSCQPSDFSLLLRLQFIFVRSCASSIFKTRQPLVIIITAAAIAVASVVRSFFIRRCCSPFCPSCVYKLYLIHNFYKCVFQSNWTFRERKKKATRN